MNSQRWQEVKTTFERVVAAAPEQRQRLIAELCGDDHELRDDIIRLPEAHEKAESLWKWRFA